MNDRLYRTRDDRIIGGVAGGVAEYFAIDPSLVRIVWALLALFSGGALLLLYIVMWIVIPEEPLEWTAPTTGPGTGPSGATAPGTADAATGATEPSGAPGTVAANGPSTASTTSAPGGLPGLIPPPPPPFSYDWRTQRAMERARRRSERRTARAGRSDASGAVIFGIILVVLGGWFLLQQYMPWLDAGRVWPLVLILIGAVVLVGAIRPGERRG